MDTLNSKTEKGDFVNLIKIEDVIEGLWNEDKEVFLRQHDLIELDIGSEFNYLCVKGATSEDSQIKAIKDSAYYTDETITQITPRSYEIKEIN